MRNTPRSARPTASSSSSASDEPSRPAAIARGAGDRISPAARRLTDRRYQEAGVGEQAVAPRTEPIPAATLIVMRERADGAGPDLLMVQRSRAMAFAPGALVFPGGRIDPGDHVLAGPGNEERAARIAAIRETLEETGLAIGLDLAPDAVAPLRAALAGGEPFGDLLAQAGAALNPERLVPFARWLPSHRMARVFDARFYLALLPGDAVVASVDGTENDRLFWASAAEVLAQADAGEAKLIFPTRRNLERMARFATYAAAVADARAHPIRTITPWEERRDGEAWLSIPDDLGYPVTSERMATAMRG